MITTTECPQCGGGTGQTKACDCAVRAAADRELLELAAKAAGQPGVYQHWSDSRGNVSRGIAPNGAPGRLWWNPLARDGEALRLAVQLRMELDLSYPEAKAKGTGGWVDIGAEPVDEHADARRAIVRAAAEIGKAMP